MPMRIKVAIAFEIEVDSPATISAYWIALGYALRSAAVNAVKVADKRGAEVRTGEVTFTLSDGAKHG